MKKILSSLLLAAVCFIIGCQKEIILSQPPYTSRPSIQGLIEPDSIPIIYFNRTIPFFTGSTNTGSLVIRNAIVELTSVNGTDIFYLDSTYDRILCKYFYFYKGTTPILWNTTYNLSITDSVENYTATTTTAISPSTIDSITYTSAFTDIYGEHEGVIVYLKDVPSQVNYYRYEMVRIITDSTKYREINLSSYCIGLDTITITELGRSVYSDQNIDGQEIIIIVEPAYSHYEGLETLVRIQTIDKAAYDFYDQLDKQKLGILNPFVEPTFLKDGQFGNKAIGFFGCKTHSPPLAFVFPE